MARPLLDVVDLLTDPDFADTCLYRNRNEQVVGENGLATLITTRTRFAGVVTSINDNDLRRKADGELINGSIMVCTRFNIITGMAGYTADIIEWNGERYTAVESQDYSRYGRGFVEVTCDLLPLSG